MKKKICIIEDEFLLSNAMRMSALGDYFEVISAPNGEEGLELIKSEKPDLVLLDLMMPEMNGFEVLQAVKTDEAIRDTKIIVLSNDSTDDSRDRAMKLGAFDYHVKADADLSALAEKISKVLS